MCWVVVDKWSEGTVAISPATDYEGVDRNRFPVTVDEHTLSCIIAYHAHLDGSI